MTDQPPPEQRARPWDDPGVHRSDVRIMPVLLTFAVYTLAVALLPALGAEPVVALGIAVLAALPVTSAGRVRPSVPPGPAPARVKVDTLLYEFPPGRAWVSLHGARLHIQVRRASPAWWVVLPLVGLFGLLVCCAALDPFSVIWMIEGGIRPPRPTYPAWMFPLGFVVGIWLTSIAVIRASTPTRLVLPTTSIDSARRDGRTLVVTLTQHDASDPLTIRGEPEVLHALLGALHAAGVRVDPGKSPV